MGREKEKNKRRKLTNRRCIAFQSKATGKYNFSAPLLLLTVKLFRLLKEKCIIFKDLIGFGEGGGDIENF